MLFYNFSATQADTDLARKILEIGYWLLSENGFAGAPRCLEYVDFHAGKVHRIQRENKNTINQVKRNIPVIEALWQGA